MDSQVKHAPSAIAPRLRLTVKALGLMQSEVADRAGIPRNAFNQYYSGKRTLTLAPAQSLCDEFGLTLDWLFRGDPSDLPQKLASKISELKSKYS
jgi:transcriptional regulator with XRE-family HTH domain